MNNNPNLNPGNTNLPNQPQNAPGINPVPANPVNPNILTNPNLTAPANPVPNPNITNTPSAPATSPAPGMPMTNMAPNPAPMPNPNAPVGQALNPLNTAAQQPVPAPGQAPMPNPNMAPGMNPNMPNPNVALPGMAPVMGGLNAPPQAGSTVNPSMPNATPAPTAPNANGDADKPKKFDTKTIILLIAALLSVIFCVIYFVFLNPNKKKSAPATNTNQNQTENVTNNTENTNTNTNTATNTNTTPEPEVPEEIDDYDMSWMGSYSNSDTNIIIYYSSPKTAEIEISKLSSSGQVTIEVESLKKLTYNDELFDEELNLEIIKTEDGITVKSESTDKESIFNIEGEFVKDEVNTNDWSGFYEIDGGQIVINEIYDNGGRIELSGKNAISTLSYELKNNTITIKAKSFTKDDTVIKKDGDKLIVTSDEYLAGTYTKLK